VYVFTMYSVTFHQHYYHDSSIAVVTCFWTFAPFSHQWDRFFGIVKRHQTTSLENLTPVFIGAYELKKITRFILLSIKCYMYMHTRLFIHLLKKWKIIILNSHQTQKTFMYILCRVDLCVRNACGKNLLRFS